MEKKEKEDTSCSSGQDEVLLSKAEFMKLIRDIRRNDKKNEEKKVDCSIPDCNPESESTPVVKPRFRYMLPENHLLIDCVNKDFYKAMKLISEEDVISVAFEGHRGEKVKLCLLSVSTPNDVFLFDICKLKEAAFEKGLKHILEDRHIEKIVHDSRSFVDILLYCYGTHLVNVFDTLLSSAAIRKVNNKNKSDTDPVWDLLWCLENYLHINPGDLPENPNNMNWRCRPLPAALYNVAVRNVIFLNLLKEKCVKMMLGEFNKAVDYFNLSIRNRSSVELEQKNISSNCTLSNLFEKGLYVSTLQLPIPSREIVAEVAMARKSPFKEHATTNEVQTSKVIHEMLSSRMESAKVVTERLWGNEPQMEKSSTNEVCSSVQNQEFVSVNTSDKIAFSKGNGINYTNEQPKEKEPAKHEEEEEENDFSWPVINLESCSYNMKYYPG